MIDLLRNELEEIRAACKTYKSSPGSPKGRRTKSFLLRESRFDEGSLFTHILEQTANKVEAKKLESQARKLLSPLALKTLFGSKAGRKSKFPDAKEQAKFGAEWLSTRPGKSSRDAALYVLGVETPKRNALIPPEWQNGHPYPDDDANRREKSLKALASAIDYLIKGKKKK